MHSSDASGYGYHGKTLEKLYEEEQKLYKLVKVNYRSPSFCISLQYVTQCNHVAMQEIIAYMVDFRFLNYPGVVS
jgi:hypothetical protein